MRTTRDQVFNMFLRLCVATGHAPATDYDEKGGWALEHDSTGYIIHEYLPEGGVHEPFGSRQRGPSEMWLAIRFALDAIHETERTTR